LSIEECNHYPGNHYDFRGNYFFKLNSKKVKHHEKQYHQTTVALEYQDHGVGVEHFTGSHCAVLFVHNPSRTG
jgi:poly-D-alanine transfer protein DltD